MGCEIFSLEGQVALVTGAGSGIGRAIAMGLAESGAQVAVLGRGAGLDETVAAIEERGGRALALVGDVRVAAEVAAAVERAEQALGPLSVAVNNAGIASSSPAETMPEEQLQGVLATNVTGVFLCCQAEARSMLARGTGSIVNVASMSGTIANRGLTQAHYNASKAAVIQLGRSLAAEWSPRGVRVNTLSPGYTATPMNLRPDVADQMAGFQRDTPLGRMAEVTEMVGPAVFLASAASSYCTGIDLVVDGGFSIW